MSTDINKRAREFDAPLSAIIKALAKIVESPQTDAQHDADVIPRDHVMEQVTRIREAWDKISSLARALSHASAVEGVASGRFWREAWIVEREAQYRRQGMKIEQARIHAEADANSAPPHARITAPPPAPAAVPGVDSDIKALLKVIYEGDGDDPHGELDRIKEHAEYLYSLYFEEEK